MKTNLDDFNPIQQSWFVPNVFYEGYGKAKLTDPIGYIAGPVKIKFNESGESEIAMSVEDFGSERDLVFGLMELLSGGTPVKEGNTISLGFSGIKNSCSSLHAETPIGSFTFEEETAYSFGGSFVTFFSIHSVFTTKNKHTPKYWVLPLSNFISDFSINFNSRGDYLDRHSLRIFQTPEIPLSPSSTDYQNVLFHANQKNRLIIFDFFGKPGFIELLPDYKDRKANLLNGNEQNLITAVMVGEITTEELLDVSLDWLPSNFLPLLSLATGSEVGSPWIEFRDTDGHLVKRIHHSFGNPIFARGHGAIDENIHQGIGALITKSLSSQDFNESFLRVTIRYLVRGGIYKITLEQKLRNIILAYECLCEHYKIKKNLPIPPSNKQKIHDIIEKARTDIMKIAQQEKDKNNQFEYKTLKKIADRISQAKTPQTTFGDDVIALIDNFGFPDADIITKFYELNPRPDKKQWRDVIPYYRGVIMHRSFFDFRNKHDMDDVYRISVHLHDLLIRIVFKILDYDGGYQPAVISMKADEAVDWVKLDTPASRLGY